MTADERRRLLIDHERILSGLVGGLNMGKTPRNLRNNALRAATAHRKALAAIRNDSRNAKALSALAHSRTRKALA